MKKSTAFLFSLVSLLSGIILGFLFAPIKSDSVHIGCGNGNQNYPGKIGESLSSSDGEEE